ncbi:MAG: ABC-2 type transport system ATP-binding protein [Myxococcota bacterium]|jgi:ABC-2 type transport system ATP-binding protein
MIVLNDVARWYGNVIALKGITAEIGPGAVGLLGPNGAGKTTLLRLVAGLLRPTDGTVTVLGQTAWGNSEIKRRIGWCPEHDRFYEDMTGHQFVTLMTKLHGFNTLEAQKRSAAVLERVCMPLAEGGATKPIKTYSKGMRQKIKLAQALAHDPDVLILDEPLTGTDPVSRVQISDLCKELGEEGKTVLISSHVLHEVERITRQFVLIERGRMLAQGSVSEIRDLIDQHPHRLELACSDARKLGAALLLLPHVRGVEVSSDRTLTLRTPEPDACYADIPQVATLAGVTIHKLTSPDNNLEAVFRYLTGGH